MTDKPKEIKLEIEKPYDDYFIQFRKKAIKRSQSEKASDKLQVPPVAPPNSPIRGKK